MTDPLECTECSRETEPGEGCEECEARDYPLCDRCADNAGLHLSGCDKVGCLERGGEFGLTLTSNSFGVFSLETDEDACTMALENGWDPSVEASAWLWLHREITRDGGTFSIVFVPNDLREGGWVKAGEGR